MFRGSAPSLSEVQSWVACSTQISEVERPGLLLLRAAQESGALLKNGIMHHFKGILTQWSEYVGP